MLSGLAHAACEKKVADVEALGALAKTAITGGAVEPVHGLIAAIAD